MPVPVAGDLAFTGTGRRHEHFLLTPILLMRKPFIAGNWKMNLDRGESIALANAVANAAAAIDKVELAVCPPFVYLDAVQQTIAGSKLGLGAQNLYYESRGAFTGEISAAMLKDVGCQYVILGHSERRHILGETDEFINKKVHAALAAGLTPILCLGELLAEREVGKTMAVVRSQLEGSCRGLSSEQMATTVLAYEPVWAIGTGKVATPEQAEEVHLALRKMIAERYNLQVAERVLIQYGGSVKPSNAAELLSQPNIDGALVGGASLKAEEFLGIAAGAR
jgi:triosephosphate isomerase (TIM)